MCALIESMAFKRILLQPAEFIASGNHQGSSESGCTFASKLKLYLDGAG